MKNKKKRKKYTINLYDRLCIQRTSILYKFTMKNNKKNMYIYNKFIQYTMHIAYVYCINLYNEKQNKKQLYTKFIQ